MARRASPGEQVYGEVEVCKDYGFVLRVYYRSEILKGYVMMWEGRSLFSESSVLWYLTHRVSAAKRVCQVP